MCAPFVRSTSVHPQSAETLVTHFKQCAANLAKAPSSRPPAEQAPLSSAANGREHVKIDKSALTLSEPRRIRSKEHLRFVALQPCLICGRNPSHAHHIRLRNLRVLRSRSATNSQCRSAPFTTTRSMPPATNGSGGRSAKLIRSKRQPIFGDAARVRPAQLRKQNPALEAVTEKRLVLESSLPRRPFKHVNRTVTPPQGPVTMTPTPLQQTQPPAAVQAID